MDTQHDNQLHSVNKTLSEEGRLPERPALHPSALCFPRPDGIFELHLFEQPLQLKNPHGKVSCLVELLDGTRSLDDLREKMHQDYPDVTAQWIERALRLLEQHHFLVGDQDAFPEHVDAANARYMRQLPLFASLDQGYLGAQTTQKRLAAARVALIGLGGIGSCVAYALAAAGVGTLVGIDYDTIETSNLNRQFFFWSTDVGGSKTQALRQHLEQFNPKTQFIERNMLLESEEDVIQAIEDSDFVVLSADRPPMLIRRWTNAACLRMNIPYILMTASARTLLLGPTVLPFQTPCYTCVEQQSGFPNFMEELVAYLHVTPFPGAFPALGGPAAMMSGILALETIKYLTGILSPTTAGAVLRGCVKWLLKLRERIEFSL